MKSDPVKMLMKLEKQYEEFGAVKLITPTEWQPPFSFRYSDKGITTRIQHLHKLRFGKVRQIRMPSIYFIFELG